MVHPFYPNKLKTIRDLSKLLKSEMYLYLWSRNCSAHVVKDEGGGGGGGEFEIERWDLDGRRCWNEG